MTNDEYSRLAAKAAGVAIGSNGKPAFTSYEQSMKYAEALTNLHKSGINRNSTPQEIAAASVGTTVNKNGTPNISSVSQGQNYGSALKNLKSNPQPNVNQNSNGAKPNNTGSGKGMQQGSSYVNTVPAAANPTPDVTGTITHKPSPKEIEQMEKDKGTRYVCRYVFGGDTVEYDYFEEAERICGFKRNEIRSNEMAEKFNKVLYGESGSWKITEKDLEELNININNIQFHKDSKVKEATLTQTQSYIVVDDNDPRANKDGYITETQRNLLCATFALEGGGHGVGQTETFANASAVLYYQEKHSNTSFNQNMYQQCWRWYRSDGNIPQSVFMDNSGNLHDVKTIQQNLKTYGVDISFANNLNNDGTVNNDLEIVQNATIGVDTALSGVRPFDKSVQQWRAGLGKNVNGAPVGQNAFLAE